eukprot:263761_1
MAVSVGLLLVLLLLVLAVAMAIMVLISLMNSLGTHTNLHVHHSMDCYQTKHHIIQTNTIFCRLSHLYHSVIQLLLIFWNKCFVYSGSNVGNKSISITHFNADVSFNKHRIDDMFIKFIEWNQSRADGQILYRHSLGINTDILWVLFRSPPYFQ